MTTGPSDMDQRIQRVLGELGAEHEPPAGWETRVLSAIAEQRIGDQLARLGEDHAPPAGWENRVIAATRSKPRRRAWWVAMPAAAAAAAGMLWLSVPGAQQPLMALATPTINAIGTPPPSAKPKAMRGGDAIHPGYTITVTAGSKARYRAVWIYRYRDLLIRSCAAPDDGHSSACEDRGDALLTTVPDAMLGGYTAIAVASNTPIPAPSGDLDRDYDAARKAGATVSDPKQISVE